MRNIIRNTHGVRRQRGAALVVGLILLTVITLLAVAGMNSASLELVMAGNVQTRERAFQATEAGIEQAMAIGAFTVPMKDETHTDVKLGSGPEKFTSVTKLDLNGEPQPAIWGNSWNSFSTYHFTIESTGTSTRNATGVHHQGVAKLSPFTPPKNGDGTELK